MCTRPRYTSHAADCSNHPFHPIKSPNTPNITLNKILITIRGRTLLLFYQVKHIPSHQGAARPNYIQVLPSTELARFDLKGLTPKMFCVNIADMVNIHGLYSGQVENEKQIPVAKWVMNYDEFLHIKNILTLPLTHLQIVGKLATMPGYLHEAEGQYIEFEEHVVTHPNAGHCIYSGYRLTIVTETVEEKISSYAYYYLDTCSNGKWQEQIPPRVDHESIQNAVKKKLNEIAATGVQLVQIRDETDYALSN